VISLRVAFHTLGCKLNQLETESLADSFRQAGAAIVPSGHEADLHVINTCTVTSKAEQKARRLIRQALASDGDCVVLVTGCYAQMESAALAGMDPRCVVIPGDEKDSVLSLASRLADFWQGHGELLEAVLEWRRWRKDADGAISSPISVADRFAFRPETFSFHSRPSLKIQDGCDNRCSYCRVCLARGPSVSIEPREALRRIRTLEDAGRAEIVLTGVNLSQYRGEEGGRELRFGSFLSWILENTSRISFRISSFEPERVDEEFLAAFANGRVRPHIHLALQSGSDAVLSRMRRSYDSAAILEAIRKLRSVKDDPFVAADIIAGFPGESDGEFLETMELCRKCDLAWIHAFPFSARPGTEAFTMKPSVPERIAGERVRSLSGFAESHHAAYVGRWIGRSTEVVLEGIDSADEPEIGRGLRIGTSANYLKLAIRNLSSGYPAGTALMVMIEEAAGKNLLDGNSEPISADAVAVEIMNHAT
jgi:threonylcarbamoyladenosine tRNA methylthiotransferase MtaB